jgi:hypothetical protein
MRHMHLSLAVLFGLGVLAALYVAKADDDVYNCKITNDCPAAQSCFDTDEQVNPPLERFMEVRSYGSWLSCSTSTYPGDIGKDCRNGGPDFICTTEIYYDVDVINGGDDCADGTPVDTRDGDSHPGVTEWDGSDCGDE